MAQKLTIAGVVMPTPALKGVTIARNKIWSSDTGRTASGRMVGTLVAIKTKVNIKWPPLTLAQVAKIESAVSTDAFVPMTYTDMAGVERSLTVDFGDGTYTQYSWSDGICYVQDVSVDAIEQ